MSVNDKAVLEPGRVIDPEHDRVKLGRRLLQATPYLYVLLNKPSETITTLSDEEGRLRVRDLIDLPERIFPVGRLDYKTAGILLLTNDGELAQRLTHPRYGMRKVYEVAVHRELTPAQVAQLERGVELKDGVTQPCRIEFLRRQGAKALYRFTVKEGRNRLIRRLVEHVGCHVRRLVRVEFGGLTAGTLQPGQWRLLTRREVEQLKRRVKLEPGPRKSAVRQKPAK